MPQNIKINNVRSLDCKVLLDEYYDFMLYKGEAEGIGIGDGCLAADFSDFDIDEAGRIHSLSSIDNGFIRFRKDVVSNRGFMEILTGSTYHIDSADTRLFLSPVTGNTLDYIYPMCAVTDDEGRVEYLSLNGGFYQGF